MLMAAAAQGYADLAAKLVELGIDLEKKHLVSTAAAAVNIVSTSIIRVTSVKIANDH